MLRDWFVPDRPGPLVGLHVLQTGNGACFVDRWPNPRAVLVEAAENFSLAGDPHALQPEDLQPRLLGFVEAPEAFASLLRAASPDMRMWDRIILEQQSASRPAVPPGHVVRRLDPEDAYQLWGLSPELRWICNTWGGPAGLASSGYAWGAFADGRLARWRARSSWGTATKTSGW
jgi:hypothetical protein